MTSVVVFGAGGRAGRRILAEARGRGIDATPVVRDKARHPGIPDVVAGDVTSAESVERAAKGHDVAICAVYDANLDPAAYGTGMRALLDGLERAGVRRLLLVGLATTLPGDADADDTAATAGETAAEKSTVEKSTTEKSAVGKSTAGKSTAEESATGENATGESATGESAAGESATGESAVGENAPGEVAITRAGQRRVFEDPTFPAQWRPFSQARADELAVLEAYDGPVDWVVFTPPMELVDDERDRTYEIRSLGGPLSYSGLAKALLDEVAAGRHHRVQLGVSGGC